MKDLNDENDENDEDDENDEMKLLASNDDKQTYYNIQNPHFANFLGDMYSPQFQTHPHQNIRGGILCFALGRLNRCHITSSAHSWRQEVMPVWSINITREDKVNDSNKN